MDFKIQSYEEISETYDKQITDLTFEMQQKLTDELSIMASVEHSTGYGDTEAETDVYAGLSYNFWYRTYPYRQ